MSHPSKSTALIKAARQAGTWTRVEVLRTTCQTCGTEVYALPDGETPRPHLRPAVQGDPGWSEIVPVRVNCD